MLLKHPRSFQAKEKIEALGGRWKSESKSWDMPSMEAYEAALEACECAPAERPMERFWGADDYSWLTSVASPSPMPMGPPLHETTDVRSGVVFTGYGRGNAKGDQWVVLCGFEETPAMADEGDLLCGCLNYRSWLFLSPQEIASFQWTGEIMQMEKSKELYDRYLDR